MPCIRRMVIVLLGLLSTGCAVLHRVQLGDVEGSERGQPISIKVSETTVSIRDIAAIMGGVGRASKSRALRRGGSALDAYESYFQYGPRTGTPVFNEFYARDIPERLMAKCPNGRVTNIVSIRESRDYPVVKGEIVRIDAQCIKS